MAWEIQRRLEEEREIPTGIEIRDIISSIKDLRVQALFCVMYLTAGRISEVLELRQKDISKKLINNIKVIEIKLLNRKNNTRRIKFIYIKIETERDLLEPLILYTNSLPSGDSKLFNIHYMRAYQLIRKNTNFNPHWIRHCRLTNLVRENGFLESQLQIIAGWTDTKPSKNYVIMNWEDLLQKL